MSPFEERGMVPTGRLRFVQRVTGAKGVQTGFYPEMKVHVTFTSILQQEWKHTLLPKPNEWHDVPFEKGECPTCSAAEGEEKA